MERKNLAMYVIIGFGLFFLLTAIEFFEPSLAGMAKFLVFGYWGTMAAAALISIFSNLFVDFSITHMLYNLWLFCSLMCVAVGILAIVDDWPHKAGWAVWVIIYGTTVGFIKRKEL